MLWLYLLCDQKNVAEILVPISTCSGPDSGADHYSLYLHQGVTVETLLPSLACQGSSQDIGYVPNHITLVRQGQRSELSEEVDD